MCKSSIEIELEKFFIERNCFEKEYINILKEKFSSNNKQLKRLILAKFMNYISNNQSLALFDEDIFNIYKTIIDNYVTFLQKQETLKFDFNSNVLKNLSGIVSVLKSQVNFFYDNRNVSINPIYTEKKTIMAKYIDNIYKTIDCLLNEDFNIEDFNNIKFCFIKNILEKVEKSLKINLIDCFNAINDIENRTQVSYFNDILEEEREILSSIIKVQIKALEDLCKSDDEKNHMDNLLKPIIEVYQQVGKSFYELNNKMKNIDININIKIDSKEIEDCIVNIFKETKNFEEQFKQEFFNIFKKYIVELKKKLILEQQNNILLFKQNVDNSLELSTQISNMFGMVVNYIEKNKEFYEKNDLYNIIEGIDESIIIKIENIKEKETEIFSNRKNLYENIENNINNLENYHIQYNFDEIYSLFKNGVQIEQINRCINFDPILLTIKDFVKPYIKKIDDFIKNTILFEITTFQEIIYYSVVRLRESKDENILNLTKFIDNIEINIENILIKNNILPIKPKPHDNFNAKEHEVLLAEKNENFLKGQIIKVINYGYKKKDEGVIKRATIIAAK